MVPSEPQLASGGHDDSTFAFTADHRVEPGAEGAFLDAMARLFAAEARAPGFLSHDGPTQVATGPPLIYRSSSRWSDLDRWVGWMDSPQRRRLLQQAHQAGGGFQAHTNWRGYALWLARSTQGPPPAWKINLLVLLVLYPSVLVMARLLRDLPADPPTTLLLANIATVSLTGWWLVPLVQRLYGGWLERRPGSYWRWAAPLSIAAVLLLARQMALLLRIP